MKHKTFAFFIMATLTIAVFAFPADAAEVEGTNFNDTYAAEDKQLKLAGAGLLRYWGFKAYTGAL